MNRLLVLLVAAATGASLAQVAPTASADTSAWHRPGSTTGATARVVDLGDARVTLTPVGDSGRTTITPIPDRRGVPGLFLTETSDGATLAADGGAPTVVAGSAASGDEPRAAVEPADLVELHFSAIARDGRAAPARVTVMDLATGEAHTRELPPDPGSTCTTGGYEYSDCLLVPPGDYSVMAFVTTNPPATPSLENGRTVQNVSLVGKPQVHISQQRDFVFDARRARRVSVDTPGHPTQIDQQGAMELFYRRTAENGHGITATYFPPFMLDHHVYEQPTGTSVTMGSFETRTRLRLVKPAIRLDAPHTPRLHPDYYDSVWFSDVASDFPMYDGHARLRVVDVGRAGANHLEGRHLHGAIAVAERSDRRSVAEQSNAAAKAGASLVVVYNDGPGDNGDPNGVGVKLKVPTVRLDRAEGRALTRLPRKARVEVRGAPSSPYLYDLLIKEPRRIPADLHYTFRTRDLAKQVRSFHGQPRVDSTYSEAAYEFQPGDTFSNSTMFPFRGGPGSRTEYRIPDPDTRWMYAAVTPSSPYNALFPEPSVFSMSLSSRDFATYRSPRRRSLPVGTAPVVSAPNPGAPFERHDDQMRVVVDGFTDAEGNHGLAYTDVEGSGLKSHLDIEVDGETVAETDYLPYEIVDMPSGESHVSVEFTVDNPQGWNKLSTHTDTRWAFPSSTTPTDTTVGQPVLVPDYDVPVDLRNRVEAGKHGKAAFDLAIPHADGSDAPVDDLTVDASWDGGGTWIPATVTTTDSGWHVVLPRGTGFVSLRLHAADDAGSTVDQTVVRAFLVR